MFLRLTYKSMHDKYLLMEDLCLNVLALLAGEIKVWPKKVAL